LFLVPVGIGEYRNKGDGMIWQQVRLALMASVLAAAAALTVRAEEKPKAEKAEKIPAPAGATAPAPIAPVADGCAPQTRTVCVKEWVPEQYQAERTVYKTECRQENYTAYKCECVPETRTRTCTTYKKVQEMQTVCKTVYDCVQCMEERTTMVKHVTCKPVTKTVRKCVDKGHWECREVPCGPSCFEKMKSHFHHKDCCDSCEATCQRTKTKKVWVPCPVWEEHTVCTTEKVCEYTPQTCKVCVTKKVPRQVTCQVCVSKCVPECHTETYTCNVEKKVPYQATRTVSVCVPVKETYTACRMVCRTVEKQVPVCETSGCETSLCCKKKHSWHREKNCCTSTCDSGCK